MPGRPRCGGGKSNNISRKRQKIVISTPIPRVALPVADDKVVVHLRYLVLEEMLHVKSELHGGGSEW